MVVNGKDYRYVLMISKVYLNSDKKELIKSIYNNDLKTLMKKRDELYEQDRKVNDNLVYYFAYEIFDYWACKYIKYLIGFVDDEPIQVIVRWGKNGQKYVWQNIDESKMKRLIKKYGIEQVCDHTLWLDI